MDVTLIYMNSCTRTVMSDIDFDQYVDIKNMADHPSVHAITLHISITWIYEHGGPMADKGASPKNIVANDGHRSLILITTF